MRQFQPHLPPAVISDFLDSAVLSIPQLDEGADLFTQTEILHSDHLTTRGSIFNSTSKHPSVKCPSGTWAHLCLLDFGVCVESFFYFCWVNVLSSSDDHVFDSALDLQISIRIQAATISAKKQTQPFSVSASLVKLYLQIGPSPGSVPAVLSDALFSFVLVPPVALHHTVTSDHNVPCLPQRRHLSCWRVDDFSLQSSNR